MYTKKDNFYLGIFNFLPTNIRLLFKLLCSFNLSTFVPYFFAIDHKVSPFLTTYTVSFNKPLYSKIAFTTASAYLSKLLYTLSKSFWLSINPYSINTVSLFLVSLIIK